MKKTLTDKTRYAEELLRNDNAKTEDLLSIQIWISRFQHERLIHLIVTAFVGIVDMMSIVILLFALNYAAFALSALLTILFIFYIAHYYFLENGVQKLYKLEDKIRASLDRK
jgi:hypothetical protein